MQNLTAVFLTEELSFYFLGREARVSDDPFRETALAIILQAKVDVTLSSRAIPRKMEEMRLYRYTNKNRYLRARDHLRAAIKLKRDATEFTATDWFRDLCVLLRIPPDLVNDKIRCPDKIVLSGARLDLVNRSIVGEN